MVLGEASSRLFTHLAWRRSITSCKVLFLLTGNIVCSVWPGFPSPQSQRKLQFLAQVASVRHPWWTLLTLTGGPGSLHAPPVVTVEIVTGHC